MASRNRWIAFVVLGALVVTLSGCAGTMSKLGLDSRSKRLAQQYKFDRDRLARENDMLQARQVAAAKRMEKLSKVESDLARTHPAEVGATSRIVRLRRQYVIVVLLQHQSLDAAFTEGIGERLAGLRLATTRLTGDGDGVAPLRC